MILLLWSAMFAVVLLLLLFHWFPKLATWLAIAYLGFCALYKYQDADPFVSDLLMFFWLAALVVLPVWWSVRGIRRHRGWLE